MERTAHFDSARQTAHAVLPQQSTSPAIIEVENVVKTYRSGDVVVNALRGVSLAVPQGEMLAIMGPSGCGKTTLLNCISGLDNVTAGSVRIAGSDLSTLSETARTTFRARNMGFIFQFYNLLPVLSAAENVELPLIVSGVSAGSARRRALDALDAVGLADWSNHRPAQLSGGQRQRVTIARALVNNPAIVWADEPTGDLDSTTADEIMALMERLNRENRQTFVIVTHDPAIGARCDRIIRMRDGQIENEERR
ncbi:MAG: macrolide ABC transporter ATP-binding protein [Chloroflexi bacterium]|nr:MAG: macrolide ABC transporter ATP-binding protein [Chloroflexota bacterium]